MCVRRLVGCAVEAARICSSVMRSAVGHSVTTFDVGLPVDAVVDDAGVYDCVGCSEGDSLGGFVIFEKKRE